MAVSHARRESTKTSEEIQLFAHNVHPIQDTLQSGRPVPVLVFVILGTHWLIWAASHALRERTKALRETKVAKIAMVLRPLL